MSTELDVVGQVRAATVFPQQHVQDRQNIDRQYEGLEELEEGDLLG